jgi:hypothetical protein
MLEIYNIAPTHGDWYSVFRGAKTTGKELWRTQQTVIPRYSFPPGSPALAGSCDRKKGENPEERKTKQKAYLCQH